MEDGARRCLNSEEMEQKTKWSPEPELWHCRVESNTRCSKISEGGVYENRVWFSTASLVKAEKVRTRFKLKVTSRNGLKNRTACVSSFAVLKHDENTVAGYKLDNYSHVIKGETKHGNPCPVRL